jgi:hypothetical protein
MGQATGAAGVYDLPNYWGELFTADEVRTPFLTKIGGMSGGGMQTENYEFATSSEYDFPAAAQPAVTETDSLTAPTATQGVRAQVKNVTQIFHQAVNIPYNKLANRGRLSGINSANKQSNVIDEKAWQIDYNLKIIARNIEYTCLNGVYNLAAADDEANKTRGMLPACALSGGTAVAAGTAALSKALLQQLFKTMFDNGAPFIDVWLWMNSFQKQELQDIYGYAPEDRNVGGVNIKQIETEYGNISIAPTHKFMPTDTIGAFDMSMIRPVTQPTPGKGNFFYEELAKTGAAEQGQVFGMFGLDHGPAFAHGKITGLATS